MECLFLHENNFQIMISLADMALRMSNFDDSDCDQISWRFAQRYDVDKKKDEFMFLLKKQADICKIENQWSHIRIQLEKARL